MKSHSTNLHEDIAKPQTETAEQRQGDDFDAARVFADPVPYLEALGLRSELADTHDRGFPAAA